MERIKDALDRAKKQREQSSGQGAADKHASDPANGSHPNAAALPDEHKQGLSGIHEQNEQVPSGAENPGAGAEPTKHPAEKSPPADISDAPAPSSDRIIRPDFNAAATQKRHDYVKKAVPDELNITYSRTRQLEVDPKYLQAHRVISGLDDGVAEYYRMLRTHVSQAMRANQWQSLAITSPNPGAGKSVTSLNLAIALARDVNQTVLLVDLDLRKPTLRTYLTDEKLPGISDYLIDDVPVEDLLINIGVDRLVILPGNKSIIHSAEMLSSPKMLDLVEDLKARYPSRIILFDMPPLLACDDVVAFSPYFDASLLIIEESGTPKKALEQAYDMLQKTNILGTVLNKSRNHGDKGYGYGYYYYGHEQQGK